MSTLTPSLARGPAPRGRTRRSRARGLRVNRVAENWATVWFLMPIMVVFSVLTAVPLGFSLFYSVTDFDGYTDDFEIVGMANYRAIFADPSLLDSLGFTLLYAVATTAAITCLAIPLAVQLNKAFVGRSFARSLFFFLGVPSQAILGLVWRQYFSPLKSGLFNQFLSLFDLGPVPWLSDGGWARFAVIFVAVWSAVGWHATLYLAYLQAIPGDLYEQATIDGANSRQRFAHITLPQLVPAIVVSTFLLMTSGIKVYDLPYTLAGGGPANATMTVSQAILLRGVGQSQYGIGSALAVLFTFACFVVVVVQMAVSSRISRRFT